MRKSNERLQRDVLDELRWDPRIEPGTIGVAVTDGVVSLIGQVADPLSKRAALAAAERVPGVLAVASRIVVENPCGLRRTDIDIARDAAEVFAHDSDVPDTIKPRVEDAWLWLDGEAASAFQRDAAESLARGMWRNVNGLRGFTSQIVVAPPSNATRGQSSG